MRPTLPRALPPSTLLLILWLGCAGSMEGSSDESIARDGGTPSGSANNNGGDPSDGSLSADAGPADAPAPPEAPHIESEKAGPYAVGTLRVEINAGTRTLPLQLWYPAVEAARAEMLKGRPLEDIEPAGARHDTLKTLVTAAPSGCTNKTMHAADAPKALALDTPFPAVVFSHCADCTRFAAFSSAEQLASWGFVVAAPDHEGGTLYDAQAGGSVGVTPEFLETRAQDIATVIDTLLDAKAEVLPSDLRGHIDATKLGVFGHGYGSMTTGLVLQTDARVRAGVMIAAPPEDPAFGKVSIAKINQPSLFLLAREDNYIDEVGNISLRDNYENYPGEAWLVEVTNAGHWSFSDICGLVEGFNAGCGMGTRQTTPGIPFTYLDNETARGIGKAYTLAYFGRELMQDEVAAEYLKSARPVQIVYMKHHK